MTFRRTFKRHDRVRNEEHVGRFIRASGDGVHAVIEIDGSPDLVSVDLATLRHAPVVVVSGMPAPLPTTCPDGHPLGSPDDVEQYDPATRKRTTVRVVACGFCEHVHVVKK